MASRVGQACSNHRTTPAGWFCRSCGQNLCPGCVFEDNLHGARIARCTRCGGSAETLMVPVEVEPYWTMYPRFLQAVFSGRGIGLLVLVGFVLACSFFTVYIPFLGPWIYLFFYYGILASFLFRIIREAAAGSERMPALGLDEDGAADMIMSVFRLLLAAIPVWLPVVVYLNSKYPYAHPMGWAVFLLQDPLAMLSDPVLGGLLVLGFVYLPAAFTVAAMTDSIGDSINPLVSLGIIFRAPWQYLGVVAIAAGHYFASSLLAEALASGLAPRCCGSVVKMVGALWVVKAATLFLPVMTAFVLGRYIFQNQEALGFGTPRALTRPALPSARPQAEKPATRREEPAPARPAPVEAIDLETPPAEVLANALRSGNRDFALSAWRDLQRSGTRPDLPPELALELAALLEQAGEAKTAAQVAHAAASKDLAGPWAPQAIFTAARLLTERVGDAASGRKLYQYLVEQHPDHELAAAARDKLK